MNSKTLEKTIKYRSTFGNDVMKEVIYKKIFYQFSVIKRKERVEFFKNKLVSTKMKEEIFVVEALAAREYWSHFEKIISGKSSWFGRKHHHKDPVNILLDIGYHHIVIVLVKIFEDIDFPYDLGLLHKAQSKTAKPLIYDYMEWLRPIVVDQTLIALIKKKKKRLEKVTSKDIAMFVNMIKKQLKRLYFNKHLGYCITLEFWIRLNALSLLSAINHNKIPEWNFPVLRHENRCIKKHQSLL